MSAVAVQVRADGGKWWVWVNGSRFMGFKSEGDAVGVCRRLADIVAELMPGTKVTYTPVQPKAETQPAKTPAAETHKPEDYQRNGAVWRTR